MDAIRLLKADHRDVKRLFEDFRTSGDRAHKHKQELAEESFAKLELHTTVEEEIFYPAVGAASKALREAVAESLEEHHVVKLLIEELKRLHEEDERYDAKFTVLMENVEHHIEEEDDLFPRAEAELGGELDRLGEQMAKRREELRVSAGRIVQTFE